MSNLEETPANSLEIFFKKRSTGEGEPRLGPAMEASLQGRDEELCSTELEEGQTQGREETACSSLTENVTSTTEKNTTTGTDDHSSEAAIVLEAEGQVNCPICGMLIINDNAALNQHIDLCLNRGTVAQVTRCRTPPLDRPPETPPLAPQPSSSKGRKRQQRNTPEKAKRNRTHSLASSLKLDNYFK